MIAFHPLFPHPQLFSGCVSLDTEGSEGETEVVTHISLLSFSLTSFPDIIEGE